MSVWAMYFPLHTHTHTHCHISEKPRIRLGCPSRSTFSQAPRKLLHVEFGRKEYGSRTSWRGFNSTPGTCFTKKHFTKKMFWCNYFCNNYKRTTLQSKSLGLFSSKKGHASASKITKKIRKSSGGIIFVIITPEYYKRKCSKELFCNHFGQDGTSPFTHTAI